MFRKFIEGLAFGAGFASSFIVVAYLAVSVLFPLTFHPGPGVTRYSPADKVTEEGPDFHELELEEQIKRASVVALAQYEPAAGGQMKAVFKEFLKKDPEVKFYYEIGDEYPSLSYYPKEGTHHGDGLVFFFVGSPAEMRMSMTYTGDRIHSLGDIPLELFRKKCSDDDA